MYQSGVNLPLKFLTFFAKNIFQAISPDQTVTRQQAFAPPGNPLEFTFGRNYASKRSTH
jgi:hypothetical protein